MQIQEILLDIAAGINTYLSNYILVFMLVGIGLFYSIRTRFVQIRCFGAGMKQVFGGLSLRGGKQKSGLSSFQALATAIAAQVGTGNIVGASGAILIGGPGAIFWMWIIAFFGMATIYAEAVLAQKTRVVKEDGTVLGGPVYYIKKAFTGKFGSFLAGFFAVAIILALGFMGAMVQSNSIAGSVNSVIGNADFAWLIGLVIAGLAAVIFIGGLQRLASVTEKIVPIMAVLYLAGGLLVICVNITALPRALGMIFEYALTPQAAIGGGIGYALKEAISQGAKRGLFSNEAGMGSTPHAHAMANVKCPHDQGIAAMIGVFIDTFIVLTMTALIVLVTMYAEGGPLHGFLGIANGNFADLAGIAGITKNNIVQGAFAMTFSKLFGASAGTVIGNTFVAICLFFFAFSTIISWNLFGKINFEYLFGKKSLIVYSVISIIFIFLGAVAQNDLVWELTDVFNNLMVIPNAIALLFLGGMVVTECSKKKDELVLPKE